MSPPLPCQSNYAQHQGDTAMRGRNKTVERHIVDLNQLKNELGGTSSCYHVLGDGADKTLKVVQFGSGISVGIEAIDIPEASPLVGKRLAETNIREAGALVVAVHRADGDYVYNPGSEHLLEAGDSLIVLADTEDVATLRQSVVG